MLRIFHRHAPGVAGLLQQLLGLRDVALLVRQLLPRQRPAGEARGQHAEPLAEARARDLQDGRPVEFTKCHYRGDAYDFVVELTTGDGE